tara:strand:+ start:4863 stop:5123 length:261 start_codon:yes stop_codon:yes gene_type:complete
MEERFVYKIIPKHIIELCEIIDPHTPLETPMIVVKISVGKITLKEFLFVMREVVLWNFSYGREIIDSNISPLKVNQNSSLIILPHT